MANSPYKIRGVEENDELLYVGLLFRHAYSADWHVQVRFKNSEKKSVLASLIPDLAVGRLYNSTNGAIPSKRSHIFYWSQIVANVTGTDLKLKKYGKSFRNERYYLLKNKAEYLAIPQLELARVLFLQNSKMFHYMIEPVALGIDFRLYNSDGKSLIIEVAETAQLTKSQFNRIFDHNKLAYTLGDDGGRDAFLSIYNNFQQFRSDLVGNNKQTTTWWAFGFSAPDLSNSLLKVLTHDSVGTYKTKRVKVVTEVQSITRVPHALPDDITFFCKNWLRTSLRDKSSADNSSASLIPESYEIDDEQTASSFLPEKIVQAQGVHEFSLEPFRQSKTLTAKGKIRVFVDESEIDISGVEIASTDLPSLLGNATPVVISKNTNSEEDETAFEAFKAMVHYVEKISTLSLSECSARRLPKIGKSRLHRKFKGKSPRFAVVAHFREIDSLSSYTLIEIDLSDYLTERKLSTLLFKYSCLDEARARVDAILTALVEKSLSWPRSYFKNNHIEAGYIKHPTGLDVTLNGDQVELISSWAKQTINKMKQL